MRVLMLEPPPGFLEERHRLGHDRFDEMWEGVLHMVPFPSDPHQTFTSDLFLVLGPIAKARGLRPTIQSGVYLADDDYRGPDIVVTQLAHRTRRGVEGGAEFVVETLSPNDDSYKKLPFYAKLGVKEALYVHPETRIFDFYVLRDGALQIVCPDPKGRARCETLGVSFATGRGPRLEVAWRGGKAKV
jgi:Uma2 family endonuclease